MPLSAPGVCAGSTHFGPRPTAPPAFLLAAMRPYGAWCDPGLVALRCLIVDDSDHFKDAARHVLEPEGITVVGTASTTAEALHQVDELRPDLVLVDIDLGEESGFDLVWQLVDTTDVDPLSVILISTYAEKDFAEMIADSPAIAFLSKPDLSGRAIGEILQRAGDVGRADRDG
ncbi:response regulator [Streptosporangium sp. NPDC087985]|uniref:response regulator n=1 Tax=Streptosporangium sp. NPDC087985 TaxID=3366196 RepID=UPI0037F34D1C